jgi:hypothetical protein
MHAMDDECTGSRNLQCGPTSRLRGFVDFLLSKKCRNQLAPFDALVEPSDRLPTLSL